MFFVGSNETLADKLLDADTLMRAKPEYYAPRFEAIKELREQDDGTLHRKQEFRRVASLVNVPMTAVLRLLDPEWMGNKKKFYAWLKRNPQYKTYDSRGGSKPSSTVVDGKEV
jgi:hypothetical protein